MRILLIGYGKMGRTIEGIAKERGHEVAGVIDKENQSDLQNFDATRVDVAIEFTEPQSAVSNITHCLHRGIPIISGTTGWLNYKKEIEAICESQQGSFFYASNFSIGVNIFFAMNQRLAQLMEPQKNYGVSIEEIHHTEKLDEPSGTAITLSEGITSELSRKDSWKLDHDSPSEKDIAIKAVREPGVHGTHIIQYASEIDTITIKHEAHSRQGFALGAVLAAEWLPGHKGIFGMKDMLGITV